MELRLQVEAFQTAVQALQRDISASTELATDPQVNTAHRVMEVERENTVLRDRLAALEGVEARYQRQLSDKVSNYLADTAELKDRIRLLAEENTRIASRAGKHSARLIECERENDKLRKDLKKAERR